MQMGGEHNNNKSFVQGLGRGWVESCSRRMEGGDQTLFSLGEASVPSTSQRQTKRETHVESRESPNRR